MTYHAMSDDEVSTFLTGPPPRPGVVGTTRTDGRPHLTPTRVVSAANVAD